MELRLLPTSPTACAVRKCSMPCASRRGRGEPCRFVERSPSRFQRRPFMSHAWPALPYDAWKETYETLHMWTQIVGKIRLARMPWLNHTWQVTLYPTAVGLTTGRMPYGGAAFEIEFDFIGHELNIRTSRGDQGTIQLVPMSVAQ